MTADNRYLVSLPQAAVRAFPRLARHLSRPWRAASDPPGPGLGSAGGTVHLLREAWRAEGDPGDFGEWVCARPTIVVHGSGQSRRLPAYAPAGKPLIPMPVLRGSFGQRLDQTLLDLQIENLESVLEASPDSAPLIISSGDVLVYPGNLPKPLPEADVIVLGISAAPTVAAQFGVFVCERGSRQLDRCLQKPPPEVLADLGPRWQYYLDAGVWILNKRAVAALLKRSLGPESRPESPIARLDLYREVGGALGRRPTEPDAMFSHLSCAVVEIRDGAFYHFGTSRQLIETTCELQNDSLAAGKVRGPHAHPDQILQNSILDSPTRRTTNHTLWVENSHIPDSWKLQHSHVLTSIPAGLSELDLPAGICLDIVPVTLGGYCIRLYGLDDSFAGDVENPDTEWLGGPIATWLERRGISPADIQTEAGRDLQTAKLFPILPSLDCAASMAAWMISDAPAGDDHARITWLQSPRLSAQDLLSAADVDALSRQRDMMRDAAIQRLHANRAHSVFYRLDLAATAGLRTAGDILEDTDASASPLDRMYDWAWIAAQKRARGEDPSDADRRSFAALRQSIVEQTLGDPADPRSTVLPDQIVWARSPVRLDLAGGWTDTPPYCIMHGGRVTNVAVNLNGQPPVQCFVRVVDRADITIRSIDLGADERVQTYAELDRFSHPGTSFAIAKAALALAGFLPQFAANERCDTLVECLRRFGGGLEVSVLSAVPQGSGLGTSSILAATILAALGEVCGLGWDTAEIINRTLVLEQLMTTGGGWQDQAGGILPGVKLVESRPGADQTLSARWLPEDALMSGSALLYYTGITRMAKGILQDIVHGLFVNDASRLSTIRRIGDNALAAADALQHRNSDELGEVIARSWLLNQALDAGTNPPAVQGILEPVQDYLRGAKLLGAGGGGYLLMMAKDPEAAHRVRSILKATPPNEKARFVSFAVSSSGLEVTRS